MRVDDEVVEDSCELVDKSGKEAEIPQNMTHIPRPPPPFPQTLVKKTDNGKYLSFITMLKQLPINVSLIEALEKIPVFLSS